MGTLYEQSPRDRTLLNSDDLDNYCRRVLKCSINDLSWPSRIELVKVVEYSRRTNFMIDNGDRWDEQISGIGEEINKLSSVVGELSVKEGRKA